jgi:hypothetical protein
MKPAQSARPVAGFDEISQLRDGIAGGTKHLFLGQRARRRAGLAPGRTVVGIGHSRGLAIFNATVFGHLLFAVEENHFVFVGAHFELLTEQRRGRGVAIARQADVTLVIDNTTVQCVHLGDIDRQWLQRGPLSGPKLDGAALQALAKLAALRFAPLASSPVQVVPVGEGATSEKVVLVVAKGPLDFRRAIGVPELVCSEDKSEASAKRLHLGRNGGVLARAACEHHG